MCFSLAGEERVRPLFGFLWKRHACHWRLGLSPVGRSRLNAPDVSGCFQGNANQPEPAFTSKRHTVRNTGLGRVSRRKLVEQYSQARLQSSRQANTASFRVHHQSMAVLAEFERRLQAGNADRNLRTDPGAVARWSLNCCGRAHGRQF